MKWPETVIHTPDGVRQAIAPLVISCSRATDIPAFHAQWFMERLRAGYCLWQNPFNAVQRQQVSFSRCAVIVFWSKDPGPLLPHLEEIAARGIQFYFHFTLNDYVREGLEPGLPPLSRRIATFRELAERIGRERVIWRFDPLLLGPGLDVATLLQRVGRLARELAPYTEKLVFSFLDMYQKTRRRLRRLDPGFRAPTHEEALRIAAGIAELNNTLARPLEIATCAEALDLSGFGIGKNRCIDPRLMLRLCPEDPGIRSLCGVHRQKQASLLEQAPDAPRDKGQRADCGCAPAKDIGRYDSCPHFCAYCYANASRASVLRGLAAADSRGEKL